jgi:hypothetical protein
MTAGLTLDQVLAVIAPDVPTDTLGDLLRRLPAKYYDRESDRFPPVTPAVLMALSMGVDGDGDDIWVTDLVDFVAADPAPDPKLPAWIDMPDGGTISVARLLAVTAPRLAALYAPKKTPVALRSKKPSAPVA